MVADRWSSSSTISTSSSPQTGSSTSAQKAAQAEARSSPPALRKRSQPICIRLPASGSHGCFDRKIDDAQVLALMPKGIRHLNPTAPQVNQRTDLPAGDRTAQQISLKIHLP